MYFDEDLVLELRLNLLDKYVDYFVIVESKFNHKGEEKRLKFNIKNFKKFQKKIIYLVYDEIPIDLYKFTENDKQSDITSKLIFNAGKRENGQRNFISNGLSNAAPEDIIIISDLDEIPNLSKIDFKKIKNEIIIFKQDMFYYKFNLQLPNFKWSGSRACKFKNLKSPQWLRNIKDKKFSFLRIDTFFSNTKYMNVKIITEGGWHYTNIKTAKEIELKLKSYLHHHEFEITGINLKNIEDIMEKKRAIYNLGVDQKQSKFGIGPSLYKINQNEIPNYIKNNPKVFGRWLD